MSKVYLAVNATASPASAGYRTSLLVVELMFSAPTETEDYQLLTINPIKAQVCDASVRVPFINLFLLDTQNIKRRRLSYKQCLSHFSSKSKMKLQFIHNSITAHAACADNKSFLVPRKPCPVLDSENGASDSLHTVNIFWFV